MAPHEVVGRYKRYKHGTKNIVYWLTRAAASCGDLKEVVESLKTAHPHQPGRVSKKSNLPTEQPPELVLRSDELVALASMISHAKPPVDIPEGIIQRTRDVIAGRKACADWYSTQSLEGESKAKKDDEGHRKFIDTLQRVLEILTSARSSQGSSHLPDKKRSKKDAKLEDDRDDLDSIFSQLELEEPGISPLGDSPLPVSINSSTGITKVHLKLEEDNNSALVIWCLLQDLGDIRARSKRTWEKYAKGELSFFNASLTTGTSFGLLRRAEEQFAETSPTKKTEWTEVLQYLGLNYIHHKHVVWLHPSRSESVPNPRLPEKDTNIVDLLCPVAYVCLHDYHKLTVQYSLLRAEPKRPGQKGTFRPARIVHKFFMALCQALPELEATGYDPAPNGASDEFLEALGDVHSTGKIRLWHVVACQMYLDIYDLLDRHANHGVDALKGMLTSIQRHSTTLEEHGKQVFHDLRDVDAAKRKLEWLCRRADNFERIHLARFNASTGVIDQGNAKLTTVVEGVFLALTGSAVADLKIAMYDVACGIAGHGCFVLSMAHIYRCFRAMGVLKSDWQDMEFVISSFGKQQCLAAQVGKKFDGEEAWRRYLLALGNSPQHFASDRVRLDGTQSFVFKGTKMPRTVSMTSPLLQTISGRHRPGSSGRLGFVRDQLVEHALQGLAAQRAPKARKNTTSNTSSSGGITATQLLDDLEGALTREEPAVNFDYVSFTLSCSRLLEKLFAGIEEHGPGGAADNYMSMVAAVLRWAGVDGAMQGFADVLRSHIEAEGKLYIKRAFDQSSGRIPRAQRPVIEIDHGPINLYGAMYRSCFDGTDSTFAMSGHTLAVYNSAMSPEEAINFLDTKTDKGFGMTLSLGPPCAEGSEPAVLANMPTNVSAEIEPPTSGLPQASPEVKYFMLETFITLESQGKVPAADVSSFALANFRYHLQKLNVEDKHHNLSSGVDVRHATSW